jgi:hypothetical protein
MEVILNLMESFWRSQRYQLEFFNLTFTINKSLFSDDLEHMYSMSKTITTNFGCLHIYNHFICWKSYENLWCIY